MLSNKTKIPISEASYQIRQAVIRLEKMTLAQRLHLQVTAKLPTQEEADAALARLAEAGEAA